MTKPRQNAFALVTFAFAASVPACSSAPDPPIPAGTYVLQNDTETVMVVDDRGLFSWVRRSCSDWILDGGGSFEPEADGAIRVISCASPRQTPGVVYWAPNIPATRLRARKTPSGIAIDVDLQSGGSLTQEWKAGNECRSTCGCALPAKPGGC